MTPCRSRIAFVVLVCSALFTSASAARPDATVSPSAPGGASAASARPVAPPWRLWAVAVTRRAPALGRAELRRLRQSGINALLVDGARVGSERVEEAADAARRAGLTLVSSRPARVADAAAVTAFCGVSSPAGAVCALDAGSPGAAVRLAGAVGDDVLIVAQVSGPAALRRLEASDRRGRILAVISLSARGGFAGLLAAVGARNDVDLAVAPAAARSGALSRYLSQLRSELRGRDRQAPARPASVAAANVTDQSVALTWRSARDNRRVRGYGVYVDGKLVGSSAAPAHRVTGLACERAFVLAVDAVDAAGNRSPATTVSVTTAGCPPPPRAATVVNAPPGTVVRSDTFYKDPLGQLRYPDDLQRVTVVGAKNMPDYVRIWKDVWVEGKPDAPMELGPGVNEDLMQIKKNPSSAEVPEDLTFRYFYIHDLTRTGSQHTDGVQLMAGRRIRFLDGVVERVDTQPFFVRDSGRAAGGGPIEDITFQRIKVTGSREAFYSFRISGNDEAASGGSVPTRVLIIDCSGDKGVSIDQAAAARGSRAINFRRL